MGFHLERRVAPAESELAVIVVRDVFQAKYGRGDELVALFAEMKQMGPSSARTMRVMVDLSGRFFQVVTEMEVESLAAWEGFTAQEMGDERFAGWFQRMMDVTEGGSREFWRLAE